jgi:anti-anti-sigma regulatory factor
MIHGELTLANGDGASREPRSVRLIVADGPSRDRRLEDWIALNLDPDVDRGTTNLWNQIVGALPKARRPKATAGRDKGLKSRGGWDRFTVVHKRGATVVRITDRTLVQRSDIDEWADDLRDLIEVGNHRIVLNFAKVERLGSWIVAAVVEAHRLCGAHPGGRLKVCGLESQLREVFRIIGMGRRIFMAEDEAQAVDGPWPESAPRTLPVDILSTLVDALALPPIGGGAPVGPDDGVMLEMGSRPAERPSKLGELDGRVWLRVEVDGSEGRTLAVARRRLLIGRERGGHLRLGSPQVSKRHAMIEVRDGRVFLSDLGSTNGTRLNGEVLTNAEAELHSLDEFTIGPARCRVWIGVSREELEGLGAIEPSGTIGQLAVDDAEEADPTSTAELPAQDPGAEDPAARIKHEVVQGILIVTPVLTDLEDEAANEALRERLFELAEQPLPRRVVIDLEFVGRLSRRTIGVILAHHLRLDRAGGSVRISGAHPRVMALLDQVRFTMLVDCFPTLDEAVLAAWDAPRPVE